MRLADPELRRWLDAVNATGAPPLSQTVEVRRVPRSRPSGPDLPVVVDLAPRGLPRMRLYRPRPGGLPLVLYAHGGFFVFGDLESHDRACRRLALRAEAAVLAVDYRLAPEHPAPAAVDDLAAVYGWAMSRGGELGGVYGPPALAGDSAGGAIVALTAQRLAEEGGVPSALLLINPNADLTLSCPSVATNGQGWGIDTADLAWAIEQWVPHDRATLLPRYSPLHAELDRLPPALIATAEHDPLRDEGTALARRLGELGVRVGLAPQPGLVHGFLNLDTVSPAARRAGDELMRRFGRMLPRGDADG